MQKSLLLKVLTIGVLMLVLTIPLSLIGVIVSEREGRQHEVVQEIANSYASAQIVAGPVLMQPWTERFMEDVSTTDENGKPVRRRSMRTVEHLRALMPASLDLSGDIGTDVKRRGLFRTPVWDWNATAAGEFHWEPGTPDRVRDDSEVAWGEPYLAVVMSDARGVSSSPALHWGDAGQGTPLPCLRGSGVTFAPVGIHAPLPAFDRLVRQTLPFSLKLRLRGTERLDIAPLGDSTHVALSSSWPHPSFGGRFLPDPQSQSVGESGFKARWSVTSLSSEAAAQFQQALRDGSRCNGASCLETLGVRLMEPVNHYTLSERALKYGFLFVALVFAAFFLYEIAQRLRIHPAQYLLVGLALALFFLLVLSLSEHLSFGLAYALAAGACIGLIGFYLAHVLGSPRRGISFSCGLGLLFAALYGLLSSEDNALVLGALLLFVLLAGAMVATRRLDWYRLGGGHVPATTAE